MSVASLNATVVTLNLMAEVADGIAAAKMQQVKEAAESEGLLLPGQNGNDAIEAAVRRVKGLVPAAAASNSTDGNRIDLGDIYDELPCQLRSRIVAIGLLSYAESLVNECHNRVDQREALKFIDELRSELGEAFDFDAPGIDGAL